MRADAHVHLFARGFTSSPLGPPPASRDELAEYERLRRAFAIELALVIGYERESEYLGNNDHILELAGQHTWVVPLPYLHPTPAPSVGELQALKARGAAGFSLYLYDASEGEAFASWPDAVWAELEDQRAILSVNARPAAAGPIAGAVARLRGCRVLFSHIGLPGQAAGTPGREQLERLRPLLDLARYDHIGVKLSGLYAVSDPYHDFPHREAWHYADALLRSFGPTRLYWSSDFPAALDYVSFAQTADLRAIGGRPSDEMAAIAGGNLLRLVDRL